MMICKLLLLIIIMSVMFVLMHLLYILRNLMILYFKMFPLIPLKGLLVAVSDPKAVPELLSPKGGVYGTVLYYRTVLGVLVGNMHMIRFRSLGINVPSQTFPTGPHLRVVFCKLKAPTYIEL